MSWAPRRSARSAKRSASIARRNNPAFFRELPDLDLHIVNYGTLFGYLLLPAAGGAREQSHGRRQEWAPRLRSVQSRYRFVSILPDYGVL